MEWVRCALISYLSSLRLLIHSRPRTIVNRRRGYLSNRWGIDSPVRDTGLALYSAAIPVHSRSPFQGIEVGGPSSLTPLLPFTPPRDPRRYPTSPFYRHIFVHKICGSPAAENILWAPCEVNELPWKPPKLTFATLTLTTESGVHAPRENELLSTGKSTISFSVLRLSWMEDRRANNCVAAAGDSSFECSDIAWNLSLEDIGILGKSFFVIRSFLGVSRGLEKHYSKHRWDSFVFRSFYFFRWELCSLVPRKRGRKQVVWSLLS